MNLWTGYSMKFYHYLGIAFFGGSTLLYGQIQLEGLVIEEPADENSAQAEPVVEAPKGHDHGQRKPGAVADRLTFLNGDTLHGTLKTIGEEGVTWGHTDVKDSILFGPSNVREVKLKGPFPEQELGALTRVSLTNGDDYRGKVLSMDSETLMLDTPYGGRISLASAMIQSLSPTAESRSLYQGPNGMDDFIISQNHGNMGWEYKNNSLYYKGNTNEMLGLPLPNFPDMASIEFDIEWRGNLQFYMMFWAQDPKNQNECYTIMLQSHYIRCYRQSNKHGRNELGNANLNHRRHNLGKSSLRLLLNREEKEMYLFMNGEMIKKWTDQFDGKVSGDAFAFRALGNSPMKLNNMVIREWDGKIETERQGEAGANDMLLLTNGDTFSGKVIGIQDNVLRFETDFAELPIPINRVNTLTFAQATRAEPRRRATDVRVYFPNEERITLSLQRWAEGNMTGRSETTGDVALESRFVSRVVMNPYDERNKDQEDEW